MNFGMTTGLPRLRFFVEIRKAVNGKSKAVFVRVTSDNE